MEKMQVDAVEMTRRIRDRHAEELEGTSPGERIRFYRERARQAHAEAERLLSEAQPTGAEQA